MPHGPPSVCYDPPRMVPAAPSTTRLSRPLCPALVLAGALFAAGGCDGEVVEDPPDPPDERTLPDVVYAGDDAGVELMGDLYLPEVVERPRVVVLAHGGGFFEGSRGHLDKVAIELQAAGVAVFNVDYRLVGVDGGEFPGSAVDVRDAVRYLRSEADELGIGGVCGTWGSSAGGTLAALAAFTLDAELEARGGWPALYGYSDRAQVYGGLYGVYDFTTREQQHGYVPTMEIDYLGGEPADVAARYEHASPATHAGGAMGPVLLMHGEDDALVEVQQAIDLEAVLQSAGVDVELHTYPGEIHSFLYPLQDDNPAGMDVLARSVDFLAAHCGAGDDGGSTRGTLEVRQEGTASWDGATWSGEELYVLADAAVAGADSELCALLYTTEGQAGEDGSVEITYTLVQQGAGCADTPYAPDDGATWTLAVMTDTRDGADALFREAGGRGWYRWFDLQQAGEELAYGIQQRLPPSYGR
jgi:acetyl esterase/lipase